MKILLCSLTIDTACVASCPQIREAKRLSGSGYEPDHHWSIARSGERLRPPMPCSELFATWNECEYTPPLKTVVTGDKRLFSVFLISSSFPVKYSIIELVSGDIWALEIWYTTHHSRKFYCKIQLRCRISTFWFLFKYQIYCYGFLFDC